MGGGQVFGLPSASCFYTQVDQDQRTSATNGIKLTTSEARIGNTVPTHIGAMRKKAPAALYAVPASASTATSYTANTLR